MNIAFCGGMLLQVALHNNKATILSKQKAGTATIDFYNHFAKYHLSPEGPLLELSNFPADEAIEIIFGQPLISSFRIISKHTRKVTRLPPKMPWSTPTILSKEHFLI